MAKWTINPNLDKYTEQLVTLGAQAREYMEQAIKKGADPVADAIRGELNGLPVGGKNGITAEQKAGLSAGFGIAPIRDDGGFLNVKAGFNGYNATQTKKYPAGQPNAMIAAAIEGGNSFRTANAFVSRGIRKSKAQAEQIIKTEIENSISKIMEV